MCGRAPSRERRCGSAAKGVPHLRGAGRGDLFVHLDVRTPTKLDPDHHPRPESQ
jgi:DnaJ-class molecular chaperone